MEPVRPAADQLVVRLFGERTLRVEHFHRQEEGACLLGKAGRRLYYDAVEEPLGRVRGQLRKLAAVVARAADGALEEAADGGEEEREEDGDATALH